MINLRIIHYIFNKLIRQFLKNAILFYTLVPRHIIAYFNEVVYIRNRKQIEIEILHYFQTNWQVIFISPFKNENFLLLFYSFKTLNLSEQILDF